VARTPAEKRKLKETGDNVRRERVGVGFTQEQLAEKTDLNPRTIQKIEAGHINILLTTLRRIQAALGCSWLALLGPEVKRRGVPLWDIGK